MLRAGTAIWHGYLACCHHKEDRGNFGRNQRGSTAGPNQRVEITAISVDRRKANARERRTKENSLYSRADSSVRTRRDLPSRPTPFPVQSHLPHDGRTPASLEYAIPHSTSTKRRGRGRCGRPYCPHNKHLSSRIPTISSAYRWQLSLLLQKP